MNNIIKHAKMTFLAQLNPYKSVKKVYANAINAFEANTDAKYVGIKDVNQIPTSLYQKLHVNGNYILHTLDVSSYGGRAIDLQLHSPITGNCMSGSSSGTAINVFLGMNDVGIGTDGGGSVLVPAMSLNLYGFISPLIEQAHMEQFKRISTDSISFSPSIGFMTKNFEEMKQVVACAYGLDEWSIKESELVVLSDKKEKKNTCINTQKIEFPDTLGDRETLIKFLKNELINCDFLIAYEGPIDVEGFGDSIFGHFDEYTKAIQKKAKKGLTRVANMVNATVITVPAEELGCGWVLICESEINKIQKMIQQAEKLIVQNDLLLTRYFSNLDMYFEKGYGN